MKREFSSRTIYKSKEANAKGQIQCFLSTEEGAVFRKRFRILT